MAVNLMPASVASRLISTVHSAESERGTSTQASAVQPVLKRTPTQYFPGSRTTMDRSSEPVFHFRETTASPGRGMAVNLMPASVASRLISTVHSAESERGTSTQASAVQPVLKRTPTQYFPGSRTTMDRSSEPVFHFNETTASPGRGMAVNLIPEATASLLISTIQGVESGLLISIQSSAVQLEPKATLTQYLPGSDTTIRFVESPVDQRIPRT